MFWTFISGYEQAKNRRISDARGLCGHPAHARQRTLGISLQRDAQSGAFYPSGNAAHLHRDATIIMNYELLNHELPPPSHRS